MPADLHPPTQHRVDLDQAQVPDETTDAIRIDLMKSARVRITSSLGHISRHAGQFVIAITPQNRTSDVERATGIELE